jgi:hypothetical protein
MSDELNQTWRPTIEGQAEVRAGAGVGIPATPTREPTREIPAFKRMLGAIPPSEKEILGDADHGIAAAANGNAKKRSEARRDAILMVALAIHRRGESPISDWSTKDADTAYAIAEQLIDLSR